MSVHENSTQQGQYVQVNDLHIYYEEYGSGEPLVLIHGGMINLTMWEHQIPLLAQHFRVIALDSRGHGRTRNPVDTLDYRLLADDTAAFIRTVGLNQPLVCGYSDGGIIALALAINYPRLARAYVAGAAQYKYAETYDQFTGMFGIEGPGRVNLEQFERAHPDFVQLFQANHDAFQGQDYWKTLLIANSKLWLAPLPYTLEDLKTIGEPTLIVVGDRDDTLLPVEQAVEMYRAIPQAELAILPNADHFLVWSRGEMLAQLMLDFLLRYGPPH
jgi:pimeloyl-ACP methyl ester carboxylesterase